jgi:hypothetical protein
MKVLGLSLTLLASITGFALGHRTDAARLFSHADGFNPEPSWSLPAALRESVGKSRLTVVFAPASPGCSSVLVPPLQALRRFAAAYPEAQMVTALRPELQLPKEFLLGAAFPLDSENTAGFGGQAAGVVAAYDRAGRTLLFRVFTRSSVDDLYGELEAAYSLTAPNGMRWAALDARR